MSTIYDVAEHAGTSVATVSRVINGKGYVKESTKQKVQDAIQELNFTPSSVARNLYKKKTNTIGLLIPDITNPFFPELYKQIEAYAENKGLNVLLFNSNYELKREEKFLELIHSKIIDSAIIVSDTMKEEALKTIKVPLVTLDRKISESVSSITVNNYQGAFSAVEYLQNLGCQQIAHITGPTSNVIALERLKGYTEAMRRYGQEPTVINGDFSVATGVAAMDDLLQEHPEVDGIFASNDLVALGVLKSLYKHHLDMEHIKLIGFDGIHLGTVISPEITTMKQPIQKIAQKAINVLLNRKKTVTHIVYDVEIVIRET